jgi:GTPase SAR1 family protein
MVKNKNKNPSSSMPQDGNEAYRAFMDKLAQSNVDEYVDLPMIAVMGDTSSGKSSLLSMISQVELPSNDKLTTRCPTMLQMRKMSTKSALVKVIWKDRPDGSNVDFPAKRVDETNWGDLTAHIADAQEHIVTKQNKEVARDVVSVEMTGPHCENLTLIDLPGIVRSHGKDESASLSDDIQSLLADYLKNPRCVILAVLPANVDFHNSQIMAEALKVDPATKRTIPVLTKPDLIDAGAEGSVKELLLGHKTQDFEMGFHMVKGRGQDALNNKTTIEEGLSQEAAFFYNTEPWRGVEDKTLFGTKNLRVKLGELQMRLIRVSFEAIVSEIKAKRDEAVQAKSLLGEIPSELIEKRALFRGVKDEYYKTIGPLVLGGHISGNHSSYKMKPSAEFHLASNKFMVTLNGSRLSNISDVLVGVDAIAFVDGKELKDKVSFVKDGNVYLKSFFSQDGKHYHKVWKKSGDVFVDNSGSTFFAVKEDTMSYKLKPIPMDMVRRDPEWIRKLIEENRPYELPIFINTTVFEGIIADLIDDDWHSPSLELLDHTAGLMETAANKYVQSICEIESLPQFRQFLLLKSSEIVENLKEEALVNVVKLVARERTPYTQNHYLFENLSKLRSQRLMEEVMAMIGTGDGEIDKSTVASVVKNVFERNQAKSMDDHMAEEMQHALNAYGKVALKRFIDSIPMICIAVMQEFPKRINDVLSNVLDDDIDRLVVAPPEKMRTMKEYDRKIETLDNGIAAIKKLY